MSRVSKSPVAVPPGVDVAIDGDQVSVRGKTGTLSRRLHPLVQVKHEDGMLWVRARDGTQGKAEAFAGTERALLRNMLTGVSNGFERKLEIVGVGYRAQVQGQTLNLTLGFSHPVHYAVPEGIKVETPTPTEVVVKGIDKQRVGQVAAEIRAYRPPEPYKGKGVRYSDEIVVRKEAKKT